MDGVESKLIRLSAEGDKESFGILVEEYQNLIFTICYRYLNNREDAQDATQEAFIKAYLGLKNFRQEASFKTWLTKIAANVCMDRLRKNKAKIVYLEESNVSGIENITADYHGSPEEAFAVKESESYLQKLLDNLTPEYKVVVIMRDIQDMKYEEIASALDINLGTVKSRLNRARKALRDQMKKDRELFDERLRLTD